ncbi:unnamed protein product [Ilex paraguariensis]|uniref:Cytochrome P450 n=1 Tax=Ilex paraguariensis TaxID=185542 RepID=A0ABC8R3Y6_9AQUA
MEAELSRTAKITSSLIFGGFVLLYVHLYNVLVLKQKRVRSKLQSQGVGGPSPSFLYGNIPEMKKIHLHLRSTTMTSLTDHQHHHHGDGSGGALSHDWPSTVFPHIARWRNEYGPIFMYSRGNIQNLCITDPEMVKEVSLCTSLNLGKPSFLSKERGPLLGQGILSSNGQYWAHQRKITAPEFYLDKVKGMVNLMVESTATMIQSWEAKIENGGGNAEIKVDEDEEFVSRCDLKSLFWKQLCPRGRDILKAQNSSNCHVQGKHWCSWLKACTKQK